MEGLRLRYWTNRYRAYTSLRLEKTEDGWFFHAEAHSGATDPEGVPHLMGNFLQDNVSYPDGIDGYMGFLWNEIDQGHVDGERAQEMLDQIGSWVSQCERSQPNWFDYNGRR
ncbi:hypothetical protein Cthiooxydans_17490 [Comamonas thiooxydans]|nr:hypothetical protein Cthiooxydans_17490 [Comamonas thiooxydans]